MKNIKAYTEGNFRAACYAVTQGVLVQLQLDDTFCEIHKGSGVIPGTYSLGLEDTWLMVAYLPEIEKDNGGLRFGPHLNPKISDHIHIKFPEDCSQDQIDEYSELGLALPMFHTDITPPKSLVIEAQDRVNDLVAWARANNLEAIVGLCATLKGVSYDEWPESEHLMMATTLRVGGVPSSRNLRIMKQQMKEASNEVHGGQLEELLQALASGK